MSGKADLEHRLVVKQSLELQGILMDSYGGVESGFWQKGAVKTWVNQNDLVPNFICISLNYYLN